MSGVAQSDARARAEVAAALFELMSAIAGPEGDWRADALCAETDPELFFPDKGGSTRQAKAVCGRCEVRPECLGEALRNGERFGIWGGVSERERRKLEKGLMGGPMGSGIGARDESAA
jgi:WhiB family transcriptional regulator, redox-sensing transcriptional regulator